MTSRHYRLPSLHTLATFEASARHHSMKRAADELNVTSGAVSRQIKALEEELGVALFDRVQSGLILTPAGELLYGVLSDSFARLGDAIGAIRHADRSRDVTIASTHAFAKWWLMPRVGDFRRDHPDVCINHLIFDDGRGYRRSEVDLRVRYGFGAWPDETALRLFDDLLYPVAAPELAERYAGAAASDLPHLPLLHVDWVDPDWTGWSEFLRRGGVPHARLAGRKFSNFDVAIQACLDGQGVALGWRRLVGPLVARGELVRVTPLSVPAPGAYYLTWNANLAPQGAAAALRDWMVEQAAIAARLDADAS